jgi:RNA polymerase sigma factor (sigma-70 family)
MGLEPPASPAVARQGDRALSASIERLIVEFSHTIAQAARRYGIAGADVDEVVQDVRLRLWKLLERSPDGVTHVNASYAYRAAASAAIDLVRRDRARRSGQLVDLDESEPAQAESTEASLERLHEALSALSPSRRVAVRLHLDGKSLAEIARVLQWTEAQARNQVYRGLADLKERLTGEAA